MAMACWLLGGRNLRRNNRSRDSNGDVVQIDHHRDPSENMYEILSNLTMREGISEARRLSYLNNFISLIKKGDVKYEDFIFSAEDILYCLRPLAFDESNQLKNASFRAVRKFIRTPEHVDLYIKLKYDLLVSRQITAAGLQLCRRVLSIAPEKFTYAPLQAIVALSQPGHSVTLHGASLSFLAEIAILNPQVFIACGGVNALIRNLPYVKPRLTEALLAPLLFLINNPDTRQKAGINLHCLTVTVYIDRTASNNIGGNAGTSNAATSGELFLCTAALLCLLRSWPGLLHLASSPSAISHVVNTLYIPSLQRTMVSCLYELLGLATPAWTDEMRVALDGVDARRWQPAFSLGEGFVAAEALAAAPTLSASRVDLVEVHLSLVLRTLLEEHLLDAIVHIIVSNDTFLSVYATILLGEVLSLVHKWLPVEVTQLLPGLPNLISYAIRGRPISSRPPTTEDGNTFEFMSSSEDSNDGEEKEIDFWGIGRNTGPWPMATLVDLYSRRFSIDSIDRLSTECQEKQSRAQMSVTALDYMDMMRRNPATPSLYLAQLMPGGSVQSSSLTTQLSGSLDECIKETGVLSHQDPTTWNWDIIQAVLKLGDDSLRRSTETTRRTFLRRLVNFYLPRTGRFSHVPLSGENKAASKLSLAAVDLVDLLAVTAPDSESGRLVKELLNSIKSCLVEILSSKSAHDCFISPHSCTNTHNRDYFLLVGRFCRTAKGRQALASISMYSVLNDLITSTNHDCYIKLIISTLDYENDEQARKILSVALESRSISGRMYATRVLHALLRLGITGSLMSFIIYSVVIQLEDEDRAVAAYAVSVLHEACDKQEYLECLVEVTPSLSRLGDHGYLLLARCLSIPKGFKDLSHANFVKNQLNKWYNHFNYRYVAVVESSVTEALGSAGGNGGRWAEGLGWTVKDARLLPHLYHCLAAHPAGRSVLLAHHSISPLIQMVKEGKCGDETEILSLKAALYALSGIVVHLEQNLVPDIVTLVNSCPVYSIRAAAYIALSNVATTVKGVQLLSQQGWKSVKHSRDEDWPLVEPRERSPVREDMRQSTSSASVTSADHGNKTTSERLLEETVVEDDEEADLDQSFWTSGVSGSMRDKRSCTLPSSSFGNRSIYSDTAVSPISDVSGERSGRWGRSNSCTEPGGRLRHHSFSACDRRGPNAHSFLPIARDSLGSAKRRSAESVLRTLPQPPPFPEGLITYGDLQRINSAAPRPLDGANLSMEPEDADFSTADDNSLNSTSTTNSPKSSHPGENSDTTPVYMGITMPEKLSDLLPPMDRHATNNHVHFKSAKMHDKGLEDLKNPSFHREICFLGNRGVHNTMVSFSESDHCIIDGDDIDFDKEPLQEGESSESSINDVSNIVEHPLPVLFKSRPIIRSEIAYLVQQLSNPIMHKICKQSLLQIKQADKEMMEDPCVLSDVLYMLSRCHIRIASREFLHELFDSSYPQIWSDAAAYLADVALKHKIPPLEARPINSTDSHRSNYISARLASPEEVFDGF